MARKHHPPARPKDPFSEQEEAFKVPPAVLDDDTRDLVGFLSDLRGSAFERRLRPLPVLQRHRRFRAARDGLAILLDIVTKLECTPDDPTLAEAIAIDEAEPSIVARAAEGARLAGALLMAFRAVMAARKVSKAEVAARIIVWAADVDVVVTADDAMAIAFVDAEVRELGGPRAAVDKALRLLSYPPLTGRAAADLGAAIQESISNLSRELLADLEAATDASDAHALANVLKEVFEAVKNGLPAADARERLLADGAAAGFHLDDDALDRLLLPYGKGLRQDARTIVRFNGPGDAALKMVEEYLEVSITAIRNRRHGKRGATTGAAKALLRRPAATENRVRFVLSLLGLDGADVDDVVPTLVERARGKRGTSAFRAMSSVPLEEKPRKKRRKPSDDES